MNNLIVKQIIIGGQSVPVVDSREVAEMIDVRHDDLLKKIRGYKSIIDEGAEDSEKLPSQKFFIEDTYINIQNKIQPCFQLTRKGCDMVANKMNGKKGVLFTAEYVTRFEEMENSLKGQAKPLSAMDQLRLQYQVIEEHEEKLNKIDGKIDDLENNLPLFNVECKELQALVRKKGMEVLGGKGSQAYKDNSLRGKVYADIQHELKREFQVTRYEAIKRCQLSKAREIIAAYKVPFMLKDEIIKVNNQLDFKEVI